MDVVEQLLGLQTGWVGRGFNPKEGAAGFLQAKPRENSGRGQEEEMSWKWELQPLGQPFLHGIPPKNSSDIPGSQESSGWESHGDLRVFSMICWRLQGR